ncbi:hypothetical protein EV127DRAFT_182094 [Xylaria flabelliformis]|nr:hypothetical protein EV127DRAFT_182094 [Xylaria flabelliformis]
MAYPTITSSLINVTSFFANTDESILRLVQERFPQELERLKRAYSIPNPNATPPSTASPSQILFGSQFDEVNRTLVGLIALRWIYNDQYDTFRGTQPEPVALTRESFNWMRQVFKAGLNSEDNLTALITSIVVNDLGKDPQLAADYHSKTSEDISAQNHDLILLKAVEAGLVPSFDRLPENDKADIRRGMKLGAEFNFGQLAQAENVPVCLTALLEIRGHSRAFELRFMELLLDIAGASGHEDWTCAKRFLQSTLDTYQNVYDAAQAVVSGSMGLRDAYDLVLVRRSQMLREKGFRHLDIAKAEDRALMRLLCMGGVANLSAAQLYDSLWVDLEIETKTSLISDLNIDGSVDQPAVLPTYAPALLRKGVDANGPGSTDEKRKRLRSLLRYLCRVLKLTGAHIDGSVVVIERSLLTVVQDIVGSEDFWANPEILEAKEVPEGVVAQTSRNS